MRKIISTTLEGEKNLPENAVVNAKNVKCRGAKIMHGVPQAILSLFASVSSCLINIKSFELLIEWGINVSIYLFLQAKVERSY